MVWAVTTGVRTAIIPQCSEWTQAETELLMEMQELRAVE